MSEPIDPIMLLLQEIESEILKMNEILSSKVDYHREETEFDRLIRPFEVQYVNSEVQKKTYYDMHALFRSEYDRRRKKIGSLSFDQT